MVAPKSRSEVRARICKEVLVPTLIAENPENDPLAKRLGRS